MSERETSDFASQGAIPFPPIHEDSKVVGEFSDEKKWPYEKLNGRLKRYLDFLSYDDPMPRAKDGASRIVEHIMFELLYREGVFDTKVEDETTEDPRH